MNLGISYSNDVSVIVIPFVTLSFTKINIVIAYNDRE
jgi:hypothetical protein